MRLLALHQDVIVFVSRVWQTTATAVRSGDEGFLIDSPVYPDELEALPSVAEQAQFPVSGLLATHADWDHLLGRLAFPQAALGCAHSTGARLNAEPGGVQRGLRHFDEEHYVEARAPLSLGGVQELPVPGKLSVGATEELELHVAEGHTADGMAIWVPWASVLVCGDYLSPVEIPMLSPGGSVQAYEETLVRLGALVPQAEWVVPGHGAPVSGTRAAELQAEDLAYVQALKAGQGDIRLPDGRRNGRQRQIHAENVANLADLKIR
jgi:glyoxylase-like metal-dependent hydrolase (beta-lactamase superfamily II)